MSRLIAIKTASATHTGRVRTNNEDAVWVDPDMDLLIVADGLGGHASGEKASAIAVSTIPALFKRLSESGDPHEPLDGRMSAETNRLGFCVQEANRAIWEAAQSNPRDYGMGSTCTAIYIHNDRFSVAHVGDSRCYLIRNGEIRQVTEDHLFVTEQLRRGEITAAEAAAANQNILSRALGVEPHVPVDIDERPLAEGDVLLLCTDGLNKELTDAELLWAVEQTPDAAELVQRLVGLANAAEGRDNVTVAVARVERQTHA